MKYLPIWFAAVILFGCNAQQDQNAQDAKDRVDAGIAKAQDAGADALMTGKVKSAIMTANDVKIEDLNVDTVGDTVTLKGKAADAKSRDTAESIAKSQAGNDYKVANEITIG